MIDTPRKRLALTVTLIVLLAVWQAVQVQRERAARLVFENEIRVRLDELAGQPGTR